MGVLQKVKVTKFFQDEAGAHEKGEEISVTPEVAARLIELKKAEPVKGKDKEVQSA